ncbi:MAG: UDP-N-acetylglucosamine 1-carboxyvinyltransferase [Armatimonadetes bacterium]|nr:UDP-N-acetylglucosamine 1-carboxyvinyltransferase [Armatimonadota bacterium]
MARLVICGPTPLRGTIQASGAKNAALPIMAASILARGEVILHRVPNISDVWTMTEILRAMGARVDYNGDGRMRLDTSRVATTAPDELVRQMNASFDIAGPLLACYGEANVSLPGGCKLGPRPVNLHIEGFRKLGAEVTAEHGFVKARASKLKGAHILFPMVSVGATKNCMMAATLAEGETVIRNCAREPEIVDLANFLVAMGARIEGIGHSTVRVHGVKKLHGTEYSIIGDRIETGTFLIGAALTAGEITIEQCTANHLEALLGRLAEAGQDIELRDNAIRLRARRPIKPLEIATAPYPGFPTDLHPQIVSMLALADGASVLQENIFSGRWMYVMELVRLGADVRVSDRQILIRGVPRLTGAPVDAPDIRAGGALVLAALAAEGETIISGVEYIDRGYQDIEGRLISLGADITRVEQPLQPIAG